jgi:RNA polymerase sigma factor for flagellar operon FliA
MDKDQLNNLVKEHSKWVRSLAWKRARLCPTSIDVDDLYQIGLIGLLEAAENFDDTQPAEFKTFAIHRVKGAMIDALRAEDELSRKTRQAIKQINATVVALEHKLGRKTTAAEVARELRMAIDTYYKLVTTAAMLTQEQVAENLEEVHESQPDTELEFKELFTIAIESISKFSERDQKLLIDYYFEEKTQEELAAEHGVTDTRIHQRLKAMIEKLRQQLTIRTVPALSYLPTQEPLVVTANTRWG